MKLIKDSLWNMLAIIIPAIIAIPVFSLISKTVGVELFGIYTLSFAVIGYASVFDLGLSRAVIREVAIHQSSLDKLQDIINTALSLILILGALAFLIVFLFAPFLSTIMQVSDYFYNDVVVGLKWLAICIPLLLISNIWLAYFEGLAQFKNLSLVKIFAYTAMVIIPLLFAYIEPTFTMLMLGILLARILTLLVAYLWIKKYINLRFNIQKNTAKDLFYFGGWLTVSSTIGPIMVYLDRFILSSIIGAKSVAFYTAPAELVVRMASIPSAAARTLFVRFSGQSDGGEQRIYWLSIALLFAGIVLLIAPFFIFAPQVLNVWLGAEFLGDSVIVLRILLIGLIFNAIAQVPYSALQANGYSKLTAIIHSAEVLPYVALLYGLIKTYGIMGAAVAWFIRMAIDTLLLFYFKKRLIV